MPFKSEAQRRWMHAAESRGEVPKGTASRWEHHTPKGKKLPQHVKHKKKGELDKRAMTAWLGRKAVMPAVRGAALPIEWLLKKLYEPAGKAVGSYRARLGTYAATKPQTGFPAAVQEGIDKILREQGIYGGAGMAAVGIPALAGLFGGLSARRRRLAEEALEEAMNEKGASMNFAQRLGMQMGAMKQAEAVTLGGLLSRAGRGIQSGAEELGALMARPAAATAEFFHAPGVAKKVREARRLAFKDPAHPLGPPASSIDWGRRKLRHLGYGTAGVGAAGVTGGVVAPIAASKGKKKKTEDKKPEKKEKKEKKEAQLGTPFMDGFLLSCAQAGLDEKQTADVIEKAAQADDAAGKECKAFLERLNAVEE